MASERFLQILALLRDADAQAPGETQLCDIAATVTGLSGAAIGIANDENALTVLCASTPVGRTLIEAEALVAEGPCLEACHSEVAVEESALAAHDLNRWFLYAPLAVAAGAQAVFAFPMRIGAVRLGALLVFRDTAGELTESQSRDGYLMASVSARAVLALQAGAPRGQLAIELDGAATFDALVQQAAGMISVQGGFSVGDALVLLRSHGFAEGVSSLDLAARVVERTVRYDRATDSWEDVFPYDADAGPLW